VAHVLGRDWLQVLPEPAPFLYLNAEDEEGELHRRLDNSSSKTLASFRSPRVEPFGEPSVDRSEKLVSLLPLALVAPEPRHARGGAQFPGLCLLLARNRERTIEICLRFRHIVLRRLERDFACNATNLGLEPSFFGCFDCTHGFANAAASVIKSVKHRIGNAPNTRASNFLIPLTEML
jgi:hypothetical protein